MFLFEYILTVCTFIYNRISTYFIVDYLSLRFTFIVTSLNKILTYIICNSKFMCEILFILEYTAIV